jgi:hypothetical protein
MLMLLVVDSSATQVQFRVLVVVVVELMLMHSSEITSIVTNSTQY